MRIGRQTRGAGASSPLPSQAPRRGGWLLLSAAPWVLAVVFIVAGAWSTMPVAPAAATADPTVFSADRAMVHVRQIARAPHPMGSSEIERVRDHLVAEVEALGLRFELQRVPARDFYGDGGPIEAVNVIAWAPGTDNTKAVVLVGHYDTVPTTPGANDNSTAVAALLETARAVQASPPLRNDTVFLFTDGEEPSERFGARGFAAVPGLLDTLGVVVNLEALGSEGASTLIETSGSESWLIGGYASTAAVPTAYSLLTETSRLVGEVGTDFDVFSAAGLPGAHFVYLRGSPIYHTMDDDLGSVGRGSLQHHGDNVLAMVRYFGNQDLTSVPAPDRSVFFTLRPFLVRYPAAWAPLLPLVSLLLLGASLVRARRPAARRVTQVAGSAAGWTLVTVVGAGIGTVLWVLVATARPSLTVGESYLALGIVLTIAALFAAWLAARLGVRRGDGSRAGAVTVWVLLAAVTAIALPGFSYLFAWPALAATAGLLWRPARSGWAIVRFAVIAGTTLLLLTPAVDALFLLAQPRPGNPDSEITLAAAVPLWLGLLVIVLLGRGWQLPEATVAGPVASGGTAPAPTRRRHLAPGSPSR